MRCISGFISLQSSNFADASFKVFEIFLHFKTKRNHQIVLSVLFARCQSHEMLVWFSSFCQLHFILLVPFCGVFMLVGNHMTSECFQLDLADSAATWLSKCKTKDEKMGSREGLHPPLVISMNWDWQNLESAKVVTFFNYVVKEQGHLSG